ncbi:MAG: aldo/keto reductase [Promethearchaeota archaeon CR_4]|nr:MAG: aldo/keto reductase [Candidatus Lokiarchaeota archaeon CR_4]
MISSKVFWPMSENINRYGLHRKNIKRAIKETLSRLKTDYIDIYFMHRFDYNTPLEETISVLDDLIHEGKIHYWGTSVWTAAQLERVHAIAKELGAKPPIIEQPLYNMLFRHIELEIMEVVRNLGMGFTAFSPLAQGVLTGKYNDGIPEKSRATYSDFIKGDLTKENLQKVRQLGDLASKLGMTLPHLALAWILRRNEISSAIIGASKPNHVTENVPAADISLNETTLAEIETILHNKPEWPGIYSPVLYYQDKMR